MARIGLFGGTFDPVHHGHLILGREAIEQLGLDRLILVPAARSPFKDRSALAPARVRLEMLREAIAGEEGIEADPIELDRPPPSYTIDTVLAVRAREPGADIHLLIGEDHLSALADWRRFDELRALVRFVVFARGPEGGGSHPFASAAVHRRIDISSTQIRVRVAEGRSIRYLVPEAVRRIIERNGLYLEGGNRHRT